MFDLRLKEDILFEPCAITLRSRDGGKGSLCARMDVHLPKSAQIQLLYALCCSIQSDGTQKVLILLGMGTLPLNLSVAVVVGRGSVMPLTLCLFDR